jgi:iron complex transport system ATP-binding protein
MTTHDLRARDLTLGYGDADVVSGLDLTVPDGRITVIVGANASGKSTLLRGLARLLSPAAATCCSTGRPCGICAASTWPGSSGSCPSRRWPRTGSPSPTWSAGAGTRTRAGSGSGTPTTTRRWRVRWRRRGSPTWAGRSLNSLSGGQRQRVWVAMALAQDTDILLLDEPTTFLDINHQVELLDLLTDLNRRSGRTIVLVLHDLNLACRYADHIVAMKHGRILAQGPPAGIIDEDTVTRVFGLPCVVIPDPLSGTPMIVARGRHHVAGAGLREGVSETR